MQQLRQHQNAVVTYARKFLAGREGNSKIAWVVPGGGKSWLPPLMLKELGDDWRLAWFVPRLNLATQAEVDTLRRHGIRIRKSGNDIQPARNTRGFVATHDALETNPDLWRQAMSQGKWLLFFDELHHAYIHHDGTLSDTAKALDSLPYTCRLLVTGTLDRANRTQRIYGVDYAMTPDGEQPDSYYMIRYDRKTALLPSEGPAIVPVTFEHHDGPVKWDNLNTNQEEGGILSALSRDEEGAGARTAVQTGIAEEMLRRGLSHWMRAGNGKALVVCAFQEDATRWLKVAQEYGAAAKAISKDGHEAQDTIKRFRSTDLCNILVTVAMAYEGLDVPSITHGICLTHYRSTPWIEQMLARAWRKAPNKDECFWWVPDDPRMNRVIKRIKDEQPASVIDPTGGGGGGGNGNGSVVPIGSETQKRRVSGLDGGLGVSGEDIVADVLEAYGLSGMIPEARRQMVMNDDAGQTQSDMETAYRKKFYAEIVRISKQYKIDYSLAGYKLNSFMGARAKTATIEQLRRGISYAQRKWPSVDAR